MKGPGIDTITFRELLTRRAGFRLDSGRVFETDDAAREQVRQGIQQVHKQVADYNNINFTIFRDMLPFMEGVPDPGPAARAAAATGFFISYVQRQVFDPAGVKDATCAPVRNAMLMYPPPDAGQHAPGTRWPHQRQPAVRQPTAADGRQLSRLGLLPHRPGRLPGQGRRHRRLRLSGPSDLLRHPRGDDPCGGSHQLQRPPVGDSRSNRPACRHQRPVADR